MPDPSPISDNQYIRVPGGKNTEFIVFHGDITGLDADVIVNAANETLSGGNGLDGAIHAAAGPELLAECRAIGGCRTGEAVITKGYGLKARHVIHTVGPRYGSENGEEDELLAGCYRNSLRLAFEHDLHTIAFPNISTGIYRYPKEEASEIAFATAWHWVKEHPYFDFRRIYFVSFTEEDYNLNLFFFKQFDFS